LQVWQQSGVLGESSGHGRGRSPRHPAASLVEGGDHVVVEQQGEQAIQEIPGAWTSALVPGELKGGFLMMYPLVNSHITIENGHL